MAFRKTKRSKETLARMQAGRAAARMARPSPEYQATLPDLRRRIIVIDYDFGEQIHTIDLYRTNRTGSVRNRGTALARFKSQRHYDAG